MLAAIAFAVAEPVGEDESLAVFPQRLGVNPRRRMDRHDEKAEFHELLPRRIDRRRAGVKVIRGKDAVKFDGLQENLDPIGVSTPVYRFTVNRQSRYIYHASFVT